MKHRPSTLNTQQRTHEQPHITSAVPYAISTIQNAEDISVFVKYTSASLSGPPLHVETSLPVNWVSPSIGYESKPVGMNITRRPPQGLERQGRTRGYSYQRDWYESVNCWRVPWKSKTVQGPWGGVHILGGGGTK